MRSKVLPTACLRSVINTLHRLLQGPWREASQKFVKTYMSEIEILGYGLEMISETIRELCKSVFDHNTHN